MIDPTSLITAPSEWVVLFFSALTIGMSKTGIQGIASLAIPLMALSFGAKESTGIILPMLCMADLMAVLYYRRSAEWKHIVRLLPTAILGFWVAIAVDRVIPPTGFKHLMGGCILLGVLIMLYSERKGTEWSVMRRWWYAPLFGLLGGFTTMIGNAAGPVMAVFLLSMRLPKQSFVGTSAWFFLSVNYLKLPLQIFVWDNISLNSFVLNLMTLPFILVGALLGVLFIKWIPEGSYRLFVMVVTVLSALMLLL